MAENVDQDVREARRWMGKLPRDQFDLLLLLMREREAAGRRQGLREAVEVAKERHNEWQFAIGNGLKRVAVSKGYAEGGSSEAEVIAAAITALIEGEGR